MSFTKVKPGGWGVNEILTSAQQTQLDADHALALDKTGDTTTGDIHAGTGTALWIDGGGSLKISSGSSVLVNSGATVSAVLGGTSFIDLNSSTATLNAIASGAKIQASVSGASIEANASGAKIQANASGASIEANVSGALIQATAAGALIKTATGGRISLGDSDFPLLPVGHSGRSRLIHIHPQVVSVGSFSYGTGAGGIAAAVGNATANGTYLLLSPVHDGATLSTVTIAFQVADPHTGGLPAVFPSFNIVRYRPGSTASLSSVGAVTFSAATPSAYYASGAIQNVGFVCDQNNVIDTTTYSYLLIASDEATTNAIAGNRIHWIDCTLTAIVDMRFQ